MLLKTSFLVLLIAVSTFAEEAPPLVSAVKAVNPVPLLKNGNKNYFLSRFRVPHLQAQRFCKHINMSLVTINSEAENEALLKFIKDANNGKDYWSSGSKIIDGKSWVWLSNGKQVEYSNWESGQPDGNNEYCLSLRNDKADKLYWHDEGCHAEKPFICESYNKENEDENKNSVWANIFQSVSGLISDDFTFGNKNFYFARQFKGSFWQALQFCEIIGMKPASILSKDENDRLYKHLRDTVAERVWWTSGTRTTDEVHWFWLSNGLKLNYTNWAAPEPNNRGREQCLEVVLDKDKGLFFNDVDCGTALPVICERPVDEKKRSARNAEVEILVRPVTIAVDPAPAAAFDDECEQPVINIYINNNVPAPENLDLVPIRIDGKSSGEEHSILVSNELSKCK